MTRDWKSLLQESKGLLVAILISLFLHLFLLGQAYLIIPKLGDEHYQIEARLVIPAPVKIVPEVKAARPPEPIQPAVPEEPIREAQAPNSPPETQTHDVPIAEPTVQAESAIDQPQTIPEPPEDADLIDKPDPYQYVETEFDLRTDVTAKVESNPVGRAKILYHLIKSGEGYEINSLIQLQGLASLVIPDLLQISKGYLTDKGLRPIDFLYQFGNKKDKTYAAKFDWETNKLNMHGIKGDKQAALVEGAQDLLSFMYQFMFVPPLQDMQLVITNGKKLDTYNYTFEGEEVINTKMGDIKTIHIMRSSADDDKDELWLALDYHYVPVKIRKTEKDKVNELLVTSLKTDKPQSNSTNN